MSLPAGDAADPPPVKPSEPEPGACCQGGCDPCVFDLYWEAVDRYEQALVNWQNRQVAGPGALKNP